jgi:hypothetical protein
VDADEVFVKSLLIGSILQTLVWFIWVYLVFQVLARRNEPRIAISAFAVAFGVGALSGAVLFSHFAIQSSSSAEPRQVLIANFVGFLSFAVVMGVLANIAEINTVGGLAPGLFFFSLDLR